MSWISLLLLICVIENYVVAITYGPSLVSLTKFNKQINGPTLFHPETGRALYLEDYPDYSVVVPLAPDSPTATSNQVFISRRISGPGEFIVKAPEGHGVMAVIQSMEFRTANTGCNDFIQFGELDGGVETTGTCGKVDNRDGSFEPPELLGPRVFLSPSGEMKVLFYHGYIWGLVRDFNFDLLDPSRNPVLRLEVSFTAYRDCDTENSTQRDFRPCSSWSVSNSRTCISSNLFCDRILNCAFEEDFGSDEDDFRCHPHLYNLLLPPPPPRKYITAPPSTTTTTGTTSKPTTTTTTTTTASTTTKPTPVTTTTTTTETTTAQPIPITTESVTEIPFTERLRKLVFEVSSSSTTTTTKPPTSSTKEPWEAEGPIFSETEKPSNLNLPISNMTFTEGNNLSVDVEEAKLELIQENLSLDDTITDDTSNSLIIGLACFLAVLILIAVCLRIYCHYHTVIWVPNPKSFRRKKKQDSDDSTVSESEPGIPEVQDSPVEKRYVKRDKEHTPPPYDILFPKPGEKFEV